MKIAFVGKGGSGKSSVSWLAVKTLESMGVPTLAIDADHNMDLTSNLGINPDHTPRMQASEQELLNHVGASTCCDNEDHKHEQKLQSFSLTPMDDYTKSICTTISPSLSLINIGLGSPEVLFQSKCAHGLSGPLKYYLGFFDEQDGAVIVDSVAGADMLSYGLYAGVDAVIGIVEPHRNSIKVFEQIQDICRKTMIPCFAVVNKPTNNTFYEDFIKRYRAIILGEIPLDDGILHYDFEKVGKDTKEKAKSLIAALQKIKPRGSLTSLTK